MVHPEDAIPKHGSVVFRQLVPWLRDVLLKRFVQAPIHFISDFSACIDRPCIHVEKYLSGLCTFCVHVLKQAITAPNILSLRHQPIS
jgi:hypothetical protein